MRIEVDTIYSPNEKVKYWHYNSETKEQWAEGVIESVAIRLGEYDYFKGIKPRVFYRIYDGSENGVEVVERSDGVLIDYRSLYMCPLLKVDLSMK